MGDCSCNAHKESFAVPKFRRILFLGNSITLHHPKPDIGWTGDWGMAASSEDKDCVHLIAQGLRADDGSLPEIMVRNIAGFERQYATFDAADLVREAREFRPDLVVVGIGENVRRFGEDLSVHIKDAEKFNADQPGAVVGNNEAPLTAEEAKALFRRKLADLLNDIRADLSPSSIFIRDCFWPNKDKDEALEGACVDIGATFVPLGGLGVDEVNLARSEKEFEHSGVGSHPGDAGMQAIADMFLKAILKS